MTEPEARTALAAQRQSVILDKINHDGAVRVSDLVRMLNVSDQTIRRDLEAMAGRGLVTKVHGGATTVRMGASEEPGFEVNLGRMRWEKRRIARTAAQLVQPNSAVALSAGTTTWALAAELADVAGLTIVTNSLQVADVLHANKRPDQTVVVTGGVRTPSDALVGPVAVSAIRSLHVDVVFMGVHGIDCDAGITTPNLLEGETNKALRDAGRRLVVLADHTKWGVVGLCQFAALTDVDTWVVDETPEGITTQLGERAPDVNVLIAEETGAEEADAAA